VLSFNAIGLCVLAVCFVADRRRAVHAVKRGLTMLWKIMPEMSFVLVLISLCLAVLTPDRLRALLSVDSPARLAAAIALTLPVFVIIGAAMGRGRLTVSEVPEASGG